MGKFPRLASEVGRKGGILESFLNPSTFVRNVAII